MSTISTPCCLRLVTSQCVESPELPLLPIFDVFSLRHACFLSFDSLFGSACASHGLCLVPSPLISVLLHSLSISETLLLFMSTSIRLASISLCLIQPMPCSIIVYISLCLVHSMPCLVYALFNFFLVQPPSLPNSVFGLSLFRQVNPRALIICFIFFQCLQVPLCQPC
jgi:hypothetical protein